jgi:uncharacterized membrane protein
MGAPRLGRIEASMFGTALRRGWADMKSAPLLALIFAGFYVLCGWALALITYATGTTFWLVLAVTAFPLLGPFAAVGFYDISRKRQTGEPIIMSEVMSVIFSQRSRQLPWVSAVMVVILLFWFFLGHMIFALFLGHMPMTNVSTSNEIYATTQGISMLAFGTAVGGAFAFVLYGISVFSLPMLLDREVDFVTAMITSFQAVLANLVPMLLWAALIVALTAVAFVPWFLGLFVVLPLLGHATWHLYALAREAGRAAEAHPGAAKA